MVLDDVEVLGAVLVLSSVGDAVLIAVEVVVAVLALVVVGVVEVVAVPAFVLGDLKLVVVGAVFVLVSVDGEVVVVVVMVVVVVAAFSWSLLGFFHRSTVKQFVAAVLRSSSAQEHHVAGHWRVEVPVFVVHVSSWWV